VRHGPKVDGDEPNRFIYDNGDGAAACEQRAKAFALRLVQFVQFVGHVVLLLIGLSYTAQTALQH
jgi:hypothetical protein